MTDERSTDDVRFAEIDARYRTVRTGIRSIVWIAAFYFAYKAIEAIAGQNTSFSLIVSVILNALFEVKFVCALSLAGAASIWAVAERKLRQRAVSRLVERNSALERLLDPSRSGSGLTK
jgi:hypothetical protein